MAAPSRSWSPSFLAVGLASALGSLCPLSGCGYALGYRAPAGVRTVAVPIFDNTTFPLRSGIEYELTSAVRRELQSRTSLRLVDDTDADLAIYGKVSRFRERVIAEGRRDEKLESNIRVTVELVVEDRINEEIYRRHVSKTEPFSVARGETIESARRRAVDNLAEKILIALEGW